MTNYIVKNKLQIFSLLSWIFLIFTISYYHTVSIKSFSGGIQYSDGSHNFTRFVAHRGTYFELASYFENHEGDSKTINCSGSFEIVADQLILNSSDEQESCLYNYEMLRVSDFCYLLTNSKFNSRSQSFFFCRDFN